jgi:hypothetical protein
MRLLQPSSHVHVLHSAGNFVICLNSFKQRPQETDKREIPSHRNNVAVTLDAEFDVTQ